MTPATLTSNTQTTAIQNQTNLKCKACDWNLTHQNVMYGHCPRCGRYIPV